MNYTIERVVPTGQADTPAEEWRSVGTGAVDFAADHLQLVPEQPLVGGEMRELDDVVYVRFPQEPGDPFPDDKTWVRITRGDFSGGVPGPGVLLTDTDGADPCAQLVVISRLLRDVRQVGAGAGTGPRFTTGAESSRGSARSRRGDRPCCIRTPGSRRPWTPG